MRPRHALPRCWLVSDARNAGRLERSTAALPPGSGLLLRGSPREDRELVQRLARIARRRGLVLVAAGERVPGAAGRHDRHRRRRRPGEAGLLTMPAHDLGELRAAERAGADLIFLSPAWPTRSHPGKRALGPAQFMALARRARVPVVALGGMTRARARLLDRRVVQGWAAVDGLTR